MSPLSRVPAHPAVLELSTLVADGVSADIYLAMEAHGIFRTIGERVAEADASTFQPMLVALQAYASGEFVLAVTRLLERQGQNYELHSVHGVLMHLRNNADRIPLIQPIFVQQSMVRLGVWGAMSHEPGVAQTQAVVDALIARLPHHTNNEALKALKALRDKRIAHPERGRAEALPTTTWPEALKLLEIPVEALAVCGAYTNVAYVDDRGRYLMNVDAARAGVATRRVLELPPPAR